MAAIRENDAPVCALGQADDLLALGDALEAVCLELVDGGALGRGHFDSPLPMPMRASTTASQSSPYIRTRLDSAS
ncbi:hypothetical protein D3C81_2262870 [compost metagenome]